MVPFLSNVAGNSEVSLLIAHPPCLSAFLSQTLCLQASYRVEDVTDVCKVGDTVYAKVRLLSPKGCAPSLSRLY